MSQLTKIRRVTLEQPFTMTITLYPQDSETATDPDVSDADVDADEDTTVGFTLMHQNGSTLVARKYATRGATAGIFSVTVPPLGQLCNAIATWDYMVGGVACTTVQYVTVIQSHYIELADIRALDGIGNATAYPTAMLVEKRDNAETLFEQATGTFWTPHYVMDVLDGDPNYRIAFQSALRDVIDYIPYKRLVLTERYPSKLLTVTLGGVAAVNNTPGAGTISAADATSFTDSAATRIPNQDVGSTVTFFNGGAIAGYGFIAANTATSWTVDGFRDSEGGKLANGPTVAWTYSIPANVSTDYLIYSSGEFEAQIGVAAFPRGMQNVQVEYVAGQNYMPADLWEVLGYYIRYLVLHTNSRIPDRSTSMTTEFGTFRIGQATPWVNPTGISEIDAVLMRYGERLPSFA